MLKVLQPETRIKVTHTYNVPYGFNGEHKTKPQQPVRWLSPQQTIDFIRSQYSFAPPVELQPGDLPYSEGFGNYVIWHTIKRVGRRQINRIGIEQFLRLMPRISSNTTDFADATRGRWGRYEVQKTAKRTTLEYVLTVEHPKATVPQL